MGSYFKSWRRRIGVAILILLAFTIFAWLRSMFVQDTVAIRVWPTIEIRVVLATHRLAFVCQAVTGENSMAYHIWTTDELSPAGWSYIFRMTDSSQMKMRFQPGTNLFKTGNGNLQTDSMKVDVNWLHVPYWIVTTPLTILAVGLLIGRRRTVTPNS